jgi:myo-inositol-1(or 4)-monophosphatase
MDVDGERRSLLAVAEGAVDRAAAGMTAGAWSDLVDKGDRDLRTDADLAAEDVIRAFLAEATPDIPVLGEEGGGPAPGSGRLWVVDPIDGTVNFVHGLPIFGVAIALLEDGRATVGVLHLPALSETCTAMAGQGARRNGVPIAVSRVTALRDAVVAVDSFSFSGPDPDRRNRRRLALLEALGPRVQRVRVHGCSVADLSWAAAGRLDASLLLTNRPWDTAAGVLLVREAGGVVTDLAGAEHTVSSANVLSAAPGIAAELAELVAEVSRSDGRRRVRIAEDSPS